MIATPTRDKSLPSLPVACRRLLPFRNPSPSTQRTRHHLPPSPNNMGLSAISASIRRRLSSHTSSSNAKPLTPPKSDKPSNASKSSRHTRNASSRATNRRPRIKDLTADEILHMLATMETVPTTEQAAAVADRVASDDSVLPQLIAKLVDPPSSLSLPAQPLPARTRLHTAWVVSTFLRHGPSNIRDALVSKPEYIRSLASVFNVKAGALDSAHATHVADVLRTLLHQYPKEVATALQKARLVSSLVRHITVQPAADLLPRFIGALAFTSATPAPLLPAHKRAIAAMGAAKVQKLLADRFINASSDILDANSSDGLDSRHTRQVIALSASTMAEISVRAAHLVLKYEDLDERADHIYAGNLGLVTAAVFNDAKRHMDFLHNTDTVSAVLNLALTDGAAEVDVIVPALAMMTTVLRNARNLTERPGNHDKAATDISKLGAKLVEYTPHLVELLRATDDMNKVGHIRIAVVDFIGELVEGLDEQSILSSLCSDGCELMRALLNLASRFPRNNMLQVRVAQIVHAAFTRFDSVARAVLTESEVASTVLELWDDVSMETAVSAIVDWARSDKISMSCVDSTLKDRVGMLDGLITQTKVKSSEYDVWASFDTRETGGSMSKACVERSNMNGGQIPVSEDFGQELYVFNLLDELSSDGNQAPPTEEFVKEATDVEAKGWGKELSSFLR